MDQTKLIKKKEKRKNKPINNALQADIKKLEIIKQASRFDQALIHSDGLKKSALIARRQFQPYYFMRPPLWRVLFRAGLFRKRMVPDFFSIGAVRSGTTILSDLIMQHPCVVLPLAKEMGLRETPISWLLSAQFPTMKKKSLVETKYGRAATGFCSPVVPSMLFSYLAPNINKAGKIVLIMRNPVERTFSHWKWDQIPLKKIKKDPLWHNFPDFHQLVNAELDAAKSFATTGICLTGVGAGGYIQHSIYLPFIKSLYETFGKKNVMLINANAFFENPSERVQEVYRFLDLPEYIPLDMPIGNETQKVKLDNVTREKLSDFFAPLNQQLYEFIGEDYAWE